MINKSPITAKANRIIGGHKPTRIWRVLSAKVVSTLRVWTSCSRRTLIAPHLLRADDFDGFVRDRAIRLLDLIEDAMGNPVQGRDSKEVQDALGERWCDMSKRVPYSKNRSTSYSTFLQCYRMACLKSLLVELGQRLEKEVESELRTALIARWPLRRGQLETLIAQLVAVLRRSPLCDVTRPEVTAAGLTAIAADPAYASDWRSGWQAMRDGADLSSEPERMWLSPSWEIYERWCHCAAKSSGRTDSRVGMEAW